MSKFLLLALLVASLTARVRLHADPQQANVSVPAGRRIIPAAIMASHCLKMVSPYYPPSQQAQGQQSVVLQIVVHSSGAVTPLRLVEGTALLESQAMNAVRLWRYRPYLEDGMPVDVMTNVQVTFVPGRPGGMISHPVHE